MNRKHTTDETYKDRNSCPVDFLVIVIEFIEIRSRNSIYARGVMVRSRIWTRRYEFNSWTRLIAFHIALIPLGKV